MSGDRTRRAVLGVLAKPRPENDGASQSDESADSVHDAGTCEVEVAKVAEPAAAPHPVSVDRIEECGDRDRVYEIRRELESLGYCARDDRCCGGGEHHLEHEVTVERDVVEIAGHEPAIGTDEASR